VNAGAGIDFRQRVSLQWGTPALQAAGACQSLVPER
jgi:hypothetical protein